MPHGSTFYIDSPNASFSSDATGKKAREDNKMIMPGDNVEMELETIQPVAVDIGMRFTLREGGKTIGTGVVTKIVE